MRARTTGAALALLLCAANAGCDSVAGDDGSGAELSYHRDIRPIIESRCQRCHVDGGIGPFPLTTYAEVAANAGPIKHAVEERIMPPWLAGQGCQDYAKDPSLDDDQIATIASWVDRGSPEGDPAAYVPPEPQPAPGLERVDQVLAQPEPYTPSGETDDYRCFVLDWPYESMTNLTGFEVHPGVASMVHHVVAFLVPASSGAEYAMFDAAAPGPGYPCFGGPSASGTAGGTGYDVRVLGAWGPGISGGQYPAGIGFPIAPGSQVVMQVHYHTLGEIAPDNTSIAVQVEPTVEREGYGLPFTDPGWLLNPESMRIPAGDADVSHQFEINATSYAATLSNGFIGAGDSFTLWATSYHMHLRGTHGGMTLIRADGTEQCLVDIPRWDFHWQPAFQFAAPIEVKPGDKLRIECSWDNSAANQPIIGGEQATPRDLVWGESTTDEMCIGGFVISR